MDSSANNQNLRSIHFVASELGIGVNTLKRFLDRNPELLKMVRKSRGGHWRINTTPETLGKLRDSLVIWKFWSRKGIIRPFVRTRNRGIVRKWRIDEKPTDKVHERQDERDRLLFEFVLLRDSGFILSTDDYQRYLNLALSEAPEDPEDNPFNLPKRVRDSLGKENGINWASFILYLAVQRLRQKLKKDPSIGALSHEMGISRASLYRIFGARQLQGMLKPDSSLRYRQQMEHRQGVA